MVCNMYVCHLIYWELYIYSFSSPTVSVIEGVSPYLALRGTVTSYRLLIYDNVVPYEGYLKV